jgi:hypothetical protein
MGVLRCRRVPPPPDEEDENYHVVKEEADMAMEDTAPPLGARDLPPEYQALVAGGYDEEPSSNRSWRRPRPRRTRHTPATATPLPSRAWWQSTWRCRHLHQHHSRHTRRSWRRTRSKRCRRRPAFHAGGVITRTSGHQPAATASAGGLRRPHLRRR